MRAKTIIMRIDKQNIRYNGGWGSEMRIISILLATHYAKKNGMGNIC